MATKKKHSLLQKNRKVYLITYNFVHLYKNRLGLFSNFLVALGGGFLKLKFLSTFILYIRKLCYYSKKRAKIWLNIKYRHIVSKKALNVRMGKGRGRRVGINAYIHPGQCLVALIRSRGGLLKKIIHFIRIRLSFKILLFKGQYLRRYKVFLKINKSSTNCIQNYFNKKNFRIRMENFFLFYANELCGNLITANKFRLFMYFLNLFFMYRTNLYFYIFKNIYGGLDLQSNWEHSFLFTFFFLFIYINNNFTFIYYWQQIDCIFMFFFFYFFFIKNYLYNIQFLFLFIFYNFFFFQKKLCFFYLTIYKIQQKKFFKKTIFFFQFFFFLEKSFLFLYINKNIFVLQWYYFILLIRSGWHLISNMGYNSILSIYKCYFSLFWKKYSLKNLYFFKNSIFFFDIFFLWTNWSSISLFLLNCFFFSLKIFFFSRIIHKFVVEYINWINFKYSLFLWHYIHYIFFYKYTKVTSVYVYLFLLYFKKSFFFVNVHYHFLFISCLRIYGIQTIGLTSITLNPWVLWYPIFCNGDRVINQYCFLVIYLYMWKISFYYNLVYYYV